jgi:outer membrane protein
MARGLAAFLTICALIAVAGAPSRARALDREGEPLGARIGYVDFDKAINEVADGVAAKKRLQDEFREKQQRLDLLQNELAAMKEKLDRDRLVLSSEALEARERVYRQKVVEVQQRYADFRREMSDRESHLTESILTRLKEIVRSIGEKDGYALILEKSQEVVLYAPSGNDLTDRVIAAYNSGAGKKKGK